MAKISVDISANVTGTAAVDEFAQSVEEAQKRVSEFAQSQVAKSLQGVSEALKEFATNALKASEAFGAMSGAQLPQGLQNVQQLPQGAPTQSQAAPSPTLPQSQATPFAQGQATQAIPQGAPSPTPQTLPQSQATPLAQAQTLPQVQTGDVRVNPQDDAAALSSQARAVIKDSTRTLEDRLEWLTSAIDKATDKLDEAVEEQDSQATQSWGDTTAELEMQRDRLKAEQAARDKKDAATSTGGAGGADKLASYFLSQGIGQAAGLVFQGMNIGSSYRMDMANGNYLGAGVNRERGVGNFVSSGSQTVGGIIGMLVNPLVGAGVSLLGSLVGGVLNADANRREADIAEGQRYQQLFAPKYGTARLYGGAITDETGKTTKYSGILSKSDHKDERGRDVWEATSVEDNATWSNELVNRAERQARGTGLSITDFMNASQTYAASGVKDADQAFKLTREAANWTKSTGASMDSLMRLQSLGAQYGVGDNVIATAYGGLKASGMERGQFDEFLSGLQQVIENGIANGFVKSAEDVASELSLFARLSGNNPLWQGQNGVNTLMQLNQGLAGAVSMQTPEQVAAVSAAKDVYERAKEAIRTEYREKNGGKEISEAELNKQLSERFDITATGGWTDYMQLLEAGNGEVLWDTLRGIRERNGDNTDAGITEITKLFHVDNKKAADIWKMILKGGGLEWSQLSTSEQKDIEAMGGIRLEEETEATQWQDALNGIEQAMNTMTQWKFNDALTALQQIEINTRKVKTKEEIKEAIDEENKRRKEAGVRPMTQNEEDAYEAAMSGKGALVAGKEVVGNWLQENHLFDVAQKGAPELYERGDTDRIDEYTAFLKRVVLERDEDTPVDSNTFKNFGNDEVDKWLLEAGWKYGDINGVGGTDEYEMAAFLYKVFSNAKIMEYYNSGTNAEGKPLTRQDLIDALNEAKIIVQDGV